jgi:hypothetical protein
MCNVIGDPLVRRFLPMQFLLLKLPHYTLAGFDLTTSAAGGDDTTRPRQLAFSVFVANAFIYPFNTQSMHCM